MDAAKSILSTFHTNVNDRWLRRLSRHIFIIKNTDVILNQMPENYCIKKETKPNDNCKTYCFVKKINEVTDISFNLNRSNMLEKDI